MLASSLLLVLVLGLQNPDVFSADGRWVARIRKAPGQERVDDRLARWQLEVRKAADGSELWSCHYRQRGVEGRALLSDDGSTFVLVTQRFSEARPVVFVLRHGRALAELIGRDFALERADVERTNTGAAWLHEQDDLARLAWRESEVGHWLGLELASSRDWARSVDLSVGEVVAPYSGTPVLTPGVDPEFAALAEPPFVTRVHVPKQALFGLPARIGVVGSHPTPNWTLGGFELEWLDDQGTSFAIHARSLPPPVRTVSAHVIEGFNGQAFLHGLRPGRYTITARGKEKQALAAQPLEVLPGRLRVRLTVTGGFAGVHDSVELFAPGVARTVRSFGGERGPRVSHVAPEALERLDRVLPLLPEDPRSARTEVGADLFVYRLEWWAGDAWLEVRVDDGTARGAVRELIELLRAL